MAASARPSAGDIIVREDYAEGTRTYVLHRFEDVDQLLIYSRVDAIAQASALAGRAGVTAWFSTDDRDFTRLGKSLESQEPFREII